MMLQYAETDWEQFQNELIQNVYFIDEFLIACDLQVHKSDAGFEDEIKQRRQFAWNKLFELLMNDAWTRSQRIEGI